MLKEIRRSMRIGKLDSVFLLIPTLFGLTFAISGSVFREGKPEDVIVWASLLMIAVAWPIWIGYIRGAIVKDDILERARGWIYLSVGAVVYIWNMVLDSFGHPSLTYDIVLSVIGVSTVGIYSYYFPLKIGLHITKLVYEDPEELKKYHSALDYIFSRTGFASIFLADVFVILSSFRHALYGDFVIFFSIVGPVMIAFVIAFIYLESTARLNKLVAHQRSLVCCELLVFIGPLAVMGIGRNFFGMSVQAFPLIAFVCEIPLLLVVGYILTHDLEKLT